jgi:hypothetical protein
MLSVPPRHLTHTHLEGLTGKTSQTPGPGPGAPPWPQWPGGRGHHHHHSQVARSVTPIGAIGLVLLSSVTGSDGPGCSGLVWVKSCGRQWTVGRSGGRRRPRAGRPPDGPNLNPVTRTSSESAWERAGHRRSGSGYVIEDKVTWKLKCSGLRRSRESGLP